MWTVENRARYERKGLRYPSDLTDAEWRLIAPLIPPAKRGGNKRHGDRLWPRTDRAKWSDHPERLRLRRIEMSGRALRRTLRASVRRMARFSGA
jgi:transposase